MPCLDAPSSYVTMPTMTPAEAQVLEMLHGYAGANRVRFTRHARQRMRERNATEDDVVHALKSATACVAQDHGRWKVPSVDIDGEALVAVVAIEDGALVVTLF